MKLEGKNAATDTRPVVVCIHPRPKLECKQLCWVSTKVLRRQLENNQSTQQHQEKSRHQNQGASRLHADNTGVKQRSDFPGSQLSVKSFSGP